MHMRQSDNQFVHQIGAHLDQDKSEHVAPNELDLQYENPLNTNIDAQSAFRIDERDDSPEISGTF